METKNEEMMIYDDRDKGYGTKLTNLCPTQRAERNGLKVVDNRKELRIRKLTPSECLKLMGFTQTDYLALKEIGMTDSAIYHMAGDSIITTCLVALLNPFVNEEHEHIEIINRYVEREIVNGDKTE